MAVLTLSGYYCDRLIEENGGEVFNSGWRQNLIVAPCRALLAGFMKNDTAMGIRSLQVGRGDSAWDALGAPVPPASTTQLTDPAPFVIALADLTIDYLNTVGGVVVTPTNVIQITATLGPGQPTAAGTPPFPLREFGLFGQLEGAPFMIDCVRHPLIEKDGAVTLERKIRLVF
jgi:hypothetical protein